MKVECKDRAYVSLNEACLLWTLLLVWIFRVKSGGGEGVVTVCLLLGIVDACGKTDLSTDIGSFSCLVLNWERLSETLVDQQDFWAVMLQSLSAHFPSKCSRCLRSEKTNKLSIKVGKRNYTVCGISAGYTAQYSVQTRQTQCKVWEGTHFKGWDREFTQF